MRAHGTHRWLGEMLLGESGVEFLVVSKLAIERAVHAGAPSTRRRATNAHQVTMRAPASIEPSRTSVFQVSASPGPKQPQSISLPWRNARHSITLKNTSTKAVSTAAGGRSRRPTN